MPITRSMTRKAFPFTSLPPELRAMVMEQHLAEFNSKYLTLTLDTTSATDLQARQGQVIIPSDTPFIGPNDSMLLVPNDSMLLVSKAMHAEYKLLRRRATILRLIINAQASSMSAQGIAQAIDVNSFRHLEIVVDLQECMDPRTRFNKAGAMSAKETLAKLADTVKLFEKVVDVEVIYLPDLDYHYHNKEYVMYEWAKEVFRAQPKLKAYRQTFASTRIGHAGHRTDPLRIGSAHVIDYVRTGPRWRMVEKTMLCGPNSDEEIEPVAKLNDKFGLPHLVK